VHVVDERRELPGVEPAGDAREDREEDILGTADVITAITNEIDSTAPMFCSIVRAPEATPRRWAGTAAIIAAVFGLMKTPEPMPASASQIALCQ
jgi:hypothetical protein